MSNEEKERLEYLRNKQNRCTGAMVNLKPREMNEFIELLKKARS